MDISVNMYVYNLIKMLGYILVYVLWLLLIFILVINKSN